MDRPPPSAVTFADRRRRSDSSRKPPPPVARGEESDHLTSGFLASACSQASASSAAHPTVYFQILISQSTQKQNDRPTSAQNTVRLIPSPPSSSSFQIRSAVSSVASAPRRRGARASRCCYPWLGTGTTSPSSPTGHANVVMDTGVPVRLPPSGPRGDPPPGDGDPAGHSTADDLETRRASFNCRPGA
jgi:hypothetical protein